MSGDQAPISAAELLSALLKANKTIGELESDNIHKDLEISRLESEIIKSNKYISALETQLIKTDLNKKNPFVSGSLDTDYVKTFIGDILIPSNENQDWGSNKTFLFD